MLIPALYLSFQEHVVTLMLAYARLAITFYMLPILGERIFSNLIIKNTLIFLVIIGLWPWLDQSLQPGDPWLTIIVNECLAGLLLAITLSLPFWIATALGEILDNQRGATLSDSIDPVNGVQSSTLSGFLNFSFGAIFISQGGMTKLMTVFAESYQLLAPGGKILKINVMQMGGLLQNLLLTSVQLAAPVLVVMMLTEVVLGVFSRYCPQLNPFSLSLSMKSFIAFTVFMLYGFSSMNEKLTPMFTINIFHSLIR